MRTASIRTLRNAFPDVLRHIKNGETVAITSRRQVVATLTPPPATKPARGARPWADLDEWLAELQSHPMATVSGADMLSADRDRY